MKRNLGILTCLFIIPSYAQETVHNLHRFMMANYYFFGNNLPQAQQWYATIVPEQDSMNVYLGYIPFLATNQAFAKIVELIPQLDELFKNNQEIQMIFAAALEHVGNVKEAQKRFIALNDKDKANQELAFKVAQIYMENAEPENALKVIDTLLNNCPGRPNNFIFHFMKAQIYLQLNKKELALAAVKQSIQTYPKFDKGWLLYAALQEQEGRLQEAITGYTSFLEHTPVANADVERHLMALTVRQKLVKAHQEPTIDPDACLTHAAQLLEKKEYTKALGFVDRCLASKKNSTQALLMKVQILAHTNLDAALSLLEQLLAQNNQQELWLETLHLLTYGGLPYKKAIAIINRIEKQKETSLALLLYKADLAVRDGNTNVALPALHNAYKLASALPTKQAVALQIALIYYDQREWHKARAVLENALALDDNHAALNNLLAYLYATKLADLSKAQATIKKALALEPKNPHILDTQALIFYKQKEYPQAVALLEAVVEQCPQDYTALYHLAKCHAQQGNAAHVRQWAHAAAQFAHNDIERSKAESLLQKFK
jgi:tetratricopeptide (TPR) repeat protein